MNWIEQLKQLYEQLTWKQRAGIVAGAVVVIAALVALQRWNQERGFAPLFTGLAAEDAGAVAAQLADSGIEYRLAGDGSTILVREEQVAQTRIQLASAGLPQTGRIGFELFDQTSFGASEFAEQVNYHRAIEGELERSVKAIAEVERARVHITLQKDSLYTEQREPAKASVLVQLRRGASLTPQNIAAITHLAASAVPGLTAGQVTVIDTEGNLLNRPKAPGLEEDETSQAVEEYRKSLEREIQGKVAQTLNALIEPGHFRIGVSADLDTTSGDQSQEIFDPDNSVIATSQTSEDIPGIPRGGGTPGTATNLPRATANAGEAAVAVTGGFARRTENVTYQTSRTVRHTKLRQGGITRLSLSVLVDHTLRYENGQPVVEAPAPEKLQVIRDLITAAIGLDTTRGDQLVVEAFPFESTLSAQPLETLEPDGPAEPAPFALPLPQWLVDLVGEGNTMIVAAAGAGLGILLALGGFLFWRRRKKKAVQIAKQLEGGYKRGIGSAASDAEKQIEARLAEQAAEKSRKEAEAILSLQIPEVSTKKTDILSKHIQAEAEKDPVALAHVVRTWLNGEYQR